LSLASALVKVAKLIPAGTHAMPVAAFLVAGDETRGVKARVRRLLEIASIDRAPRVSKSAIARFVPAISLCTLLAMGAVLASNPHVLGAVHSLIERVVSILS